MKDSSMNSLFHGVRCRRSLLLLFSISLQHIGWAQTETDLTIGVGSMTMILNQFNATEAINTIAYPREYAVYGSMGCVYGGGILISSRDFHTRWVYDITNGIWSEVPRDTIVPFYVSEATTHYYKDVQHSTVPLDIKRVWRFRPPDRVINGRNYADANWTPDDSLADAAMISDQMFISRCNTGSGLTVTQRAYAFENPSFDDFIIVQFVFTNTGNINGDQEIEYPDNQLSQCYLGISFVPQPSGLCGTILSGCTSWSAGVDDWIDYFKGVIRGENIRVMYGWDGDSPLYSADDEGDPLPASGIFMSPQYPGMAILHVDSAVNNSTNDTSQPVMSYYSYGGASAGNVLSIRPGGGLGPENIWNVFNQHNFFPSPFNWDKWKTSQIEEWTVDNNPSREYYKTGTLGFGPYNFLHIGDSVQIIVCYTVGRLGWNQTVDLGQRWNRTVSGLSGGISKNDKNKFLRYGRDSLLAKVSRISKLFEDASGNFNLDSGATRVGHPPRAPSISVRAGSPCGGVLIEWETVGAVKYRVYRRLKPLFSLDDLPQELMKHPYTMIAELDSTKMSFLDSNVSAGRNYWYSVTAVGRDGIESSKFLTMTEPLENDPTRGSVSPCGSLLDVAVVPNPYDQRSERLYGLPANTITFHGLPPECSIRIYTQSGDLVQTLFHHSSAGNIEQWNLQNESNQLVSPGIYFFTIDQTRDEIGRELDLRTSGKFVIIR